MRYRILALAVMALLIILPVSACTGYIDLSGYVYVWTSAPAGATSQVTYIKMPPTGQELTPLKGAVVVFEDKDGSHRFELTSLDDGYFHLGTTVELDEYIDVDVTAPGFQSAHGRLEVIEDESFYIFVILMVLSS